MLDFESRGPSKKRPVAHTTAVGKIAHDERDAHAIHNKKEATLKHSRCNHDLKYSLGKVLRVVRRLPALQ